MRLASKLGVCIPRTIAVAGRGCLGHMANRAAHARLALGFGHSAHGYDCCPPRPPLVARGLLDERDEFSHVIAQQEPVQ